MGFYRNPGKVLLGGAVIIHVFLGHCGKGRRAGLHAQHILPGVTQFIEHTFEFIEAINQDDFAGTAVDGIPCQLKHGAAGRAHGVYLVYRHTGHTDFHHQVDARARLLESDLPGQHKLDVTVDHAGVFQRFQNSLSSNVIGFLVRIPAERVHPDSGNYYFAHIASFSSGVFTGKQTTISGGARRFEFTDHDVVTVLIFREFFKCQFHLHADFELFGVVFREQ